MIGLPVLPVLSINRYSTGNATELPFGNHRQIDTALPQNIPNQIYLVMYLDSRRTLIIDHRIHRMLLRL